MLVAFDFSYACGGGFFTITITRGRRACSLENTRQEKDGRQAKQVSKKVQTSIKPEAGVQCQQDKGRRGVGQEDARQQKARHIIAHLCKSILQEKWPQVPPRVAGGRGDREPSQKGHIEAWPKAMPYR